MRSYGIVTSFSPQRAPTPVAWTRMRVPRSLMASIGNDAIKAAAKGSALQGKYGQTVQHEPAPESQGTPSAPAQQPGHRNSSGLNHPLGLTGK